MSGSSKKTGVGTIPGKKDSTQNPSGIFACHRRQLQQLFPQVFVEGEVDFDRLKEVLGMKRDSGPEKYSFSWVGKSEAVRLLDAPTRSVLMPCADKSVNLPGPGHLLIEGENLETLKLLAETYRGAVKLIYIDPPYNKGKDFVYRDNFKEPLREYLKNSGQVNAEGVPLTESLETSGRLHSSWLSMMYPRLFAARSLLREDGVIFVSIDEAETHNLRLLMNEVFGEENFVNILHVRRAAKNVNQQFAELRNLNLGVEYLLVYRNTSSFTWYFPYKEASEKRKQGYWTSFYNNADRPTMRYELLGVTIKAGQWKWERNRAQRAVDNYREFAAKHKVEDEDEELALLKDYWEKTGRSKEFIKLKNGRPYYWVNPSDMQLRTTDWTDLYINDNRGREKYGFDTCKNVDAMKTLISSVTGGEKGEIVLDFFAGSGTTGVATMLQNCEDGAERKFICVQIPEPLKNPKVVEGQRLETIADICRWRLTDRARAMRTGLQVCTLGPAKGSA